ncbi:MAG TPA: PleD family two-component system response regulator [Stellaceae bacterium]|jgi:two-component system cell cycle response regulator|nr:PleD family two-component system response regulator [Stellaceae bacterium]
MTARVLVVDDVELNVKLLEAKLSSEYFEVITAYNGMTALELAESESPDIILLDVMMPRMDGFEVCSRLKANPNTVDIPVVMVTALSDVADRLRGLEVGADDFLTKPVNDIALFARVRSLVRLKRMMEELRLREDICGRFAARGSEADPIEEPGLARILLLEERGFAASRIAETLAPVAESVVRANSCADAVHLLDPSTELVIASLSMADSDPLRLVSQWRATEAFRQLPILLLANDGELAQLAKGLDLGANDYLIRPVDRNELLARVRTQIRRKRLQDRLHENYHRSLSLALTDELTGLYNRRYVLAHLEEVAARSNGAATDTAVLMFDIDHFKDVNDQYGHPAGDDVLRQLAARALRGLRSVDLVARLGGEEFLVVMPETNLSAAMVVAERLRSAVASEPFELHATGRKIPVTISIGVAVAAENGEAVDDLLKRADEALYAAKNSGRNRVVSHVDEGALIAPLVTMAPVAIAS